MKTDKQNSKQRQESSRRVWPCQSKEHKPTLLSWPREQVEATERCLNRIQNEIHKYQRALLYGRTCPRFLLLCNDLSQLSQRWGWPSSTRQTSLAISPCLQSESISHNWYLNQEEWNIWGQNSWHHLNISVSRLSLHTIPLHNKINVCPSDSFSELQNHGETYGARKWQKSRYKNNVQATPKLK